MDNLIKDNEIYHRSDMLNSEFLACYDTKITKLGNYTEVKQYDRHMLKTVFTTEDKLEMLFGFDTFEIINKLEKRLFSPKGSVSDVIRNDSYHRSYIILRNYALANIESWKSFITLTIKENISDPSVAYKYLRFYVMNIKRIYPEFKYIGVPERQGRGAIHFHILTNLVPGSEFIPKNKTKKLWKPDIKDYINIDYYNLPYWSVGFSSAFDINSTDENFSIISYLSKYFWKQKDDHFFGRKKILHSLNLLKPEVEYMSSYQDHCQRYIKSLEKSIIIKEALIQSSNLYTPSYYLKEFKHK